MHYDYVALSPDQKCCFCQELNTKYIKNRQINLLFKILSNFFNYKIGMLLRYIKTAQDEKDH